MLTPNARVELHANQIVALPSGSAIQSGRTLGEAQGLVARRLARHDENIYFAMQSTMRSVVTQAAGQDPDGTGGSA